MNNLTGKTTSVDARKALRKPPRIDGQAAALQLLRSLEKMNWKRDAPAKSLRSVKAWILCASTFPREELDRFSRVISEWLVTEILGFGYDLNEYEATRKKGKSHSRVAA